MPLMNKPTRQDLINEYALLLVPSLPNLINPSALNHELVLIQINLFSLSLLWFCDIEYKFQVAGIVSL